MEKQLHQVGNLLRAAKRVLFITGAGVSAESGIPTFRGATRAFVNGLTEEGLPFEEVLSGPMFIRKPEVSWKYFFLLEQSLRGKKPNAAHLAIAALANEKRYVCVATQNIDGLHQNAGSRHVIELHGNLRRVICTECDFREELATFEHLPPLPHCPKCGSLLRPDAVLYDEALPQEALGNFYQEQQTGFDLVFSVGTTSVFPYVTEPVFLAAERGTPTIEINPEETPISNLARFRFSASAGPALAKLAELVAR